MAKQPLPQRVTRAFRELTGSGTATHAGAHARAMDTLELGQRMQQRAAERHQQEALARAGGRGRRSNYVGSVSNRLTWDWIARCMSPDDEVRGELKVLRARARELSRNDPVVVQFLNMLQVNVVGPTGARLQAQIRTPDGKLDERVNDTIEAGWARYCRGPVTVDRTMNLAAFELLQLESVARDGEAFTRISEGPRRHHGLGLQAIDADLVDETRTAVLIPGAREVRLGVEIDGEGARLGYWINEQRYMPGSESRPPYRVDAENVLHHLRVRRANQMRGITWVAAVLHAIHQLNMYAETELIAARTGAAKMGFIVTKDPDADVPGSSMDGSGSASGDGSSESSSGLLPGQEMEATPGTIDYLLPGQEFQGWTPDHPSTAFDPFTKAQMRRIAIGLGVNYNTLGSDLEGVNFSSMRSGLQLERDLWRMLQEWWVGTFRQPIFERWLNAAILTGELRLPSSDWRQYTDVKWVSRGWDWVDPVKDVQASVIAIGNGLDSRTRILAEKGVDHAEVLEQLAAEAKAAAAAGVSIDAGASKSAQPADPKKPDSEDPTEDDLAADDEAED